MAKKIPGVSGKKVRRMRKSIVRTASKSMEKRTIAQAKKVYDNPTIVLPSYDDSDSHRVFKKIRQQLEKLEKNRENVKKLEKIALKHNILGAVAGTMLIAHAEKAPFLAAEELPTGTVMYAQRGNASKEQLIGVQNNDDPFLRLLGIKDIVMKSRLHVYSWDQGFISTGKIKNPPKDFITFILDDINVPVHDSIATCTHLKAATVKNKTIATEPYIRIYWESAGVTIGICKHCTQKRKNTLFSITKYLIEPEVADDFSVSVIGQLIKNQDKNSETHFFRDEYVTGALSDRELIEKNMEKRMQDLSQSDQQMLVLNDVSYGRDVKGFVKALRANEAEQSALVFMLEKIQRPLIINDATPNMVLEQLWDDFAEEFLLSLIKDESIVRELLELHENPSTIVETAFTLKQRKKILEQLPQYSFLPDLADFTDRIARLYRTRSKDQVFTELKKGPDTTKGKAITYGFLLAIGKASDMKWKFSQVEIESGEFLRIYIETLLTASPESYHDALQKVINASGSSENLDEYRH